MLARAVADAMSRGLGKQVAVDNRPGAGGHIGAEAVAHAAPDGYTILFGTNGTLGIGPALYKNCATTRCTISRRSGSCTNCRCC